MLECTCTCCIILSLPLADRILLLNVISELVTVIICILLFFSLFRALRCSPLAPLFLSPVKLVWSTLTLFGGYPQVLMGLLFCH